MRKRSDGSWRFKSFIGHFSKRTSRLIKAAQFNFGSPNFEAMTNIATVSRQIGNLGRYFVRYVAHLCSFKADDVRTRCHAQQ